MIPRNNLKIVSLPSLLETLYKQVTKMNANALDCVSTNIDDTELKDNDGYDKSAHNFLDENERLSCKFGMRCFRKNSRHRLDVAHPGDTDYIVPDMPEANENAVPCKYGKTCYRLNPEHFKNFSHPRNINIQVNYRKYVLTRQDNGGNSDSSFDDDSEEDPFAGDSDDADYVPSDDEL